MAILFKFDSVLPEIVDPANERTGFSLEELYKLINTDMIEVVYLNDGTVMVIDENGKLKDDWMNDFNVGATQHAYLRGFRADDVIVGNAVVCLSGTEFQ